MKPPPGHISIREVCEVLGITRQRAHQLIEMGRLPVTQIGRRKWVPLAAVERRQAAERRLASNQCVSTGEVAEFFGVDERTVRGWVTRGLISVMRINNRLCFDPLVVSTFVPPTYGSSGRYPAREGTRTLRGRHYPAPHHRSGNAPERKEIDGNQDGRGAP